MSAIGDPLVDVGILLCYWVHAAAVDDAMPASPRARAGSAARRSSRATRSAPARRSTTSRVYEVFAVFKLAVVIQQIYARFVRGQTDDPRFAPLGERVG